MNKIILTVFLSFIIACNTNLRSEKNKTDLQNKSFELTGELSNFYTNRVYLNRFINNGFHPVDSSGVDNNTFSFKGHVEFPERYMLTFNNYTAEVMLIIENSTINININQLQIDNPKISGSKLNLELDEYRIASKKIFNKIDQLFPKFQHARLENDVDKLKEVRNEMDMIESRFIDFSLEFINNNSNSYLGPMILRDLIKTPTIDLLSIKNLYMKFPDSIKKSSDGQIIRQYLELP